MTATRPRPKVVRTPLQIKHTRIENWTGVRFFQYDRRSVAHAVVGENEDHVIVKCGGPHPHKTMGHYTTDPHTYVCGRCAHVMEAAGA